MKQHLLALEVSWAWKNFKSPPLTHVHPPLPSLLFSKDLEKVPACLFRTGQLSVFKLGVLPARGKCSRIIGIHQRPAECQRHEEGWRHNAGR